MEPRGSEAVDKLRYNGFLKWIRFDEELEEVGEIVHSLSSE